MGTCQKYSLKSIIILNTYVVKKRKLHLTGNCGRARMHRISLGLLGFSCYNQNHVLFSHTLGDTCSAVSIVETHVYLASGLYRE